MDETYVMNQCKEDSCFVSLSLSKDLAECRRRGNETARDYILPDYAQLKRGYLREPGSEEPIGEQQKIRMNNERVQIPELLFYPSDIGVKQIGISHAIFHSIECLPEEVRPHLYANIVLIGGNAHFKNFKERIEADIRSMANYLFDVNVYLPENPIHEPWLGGKLLAKKSSVLSELAVTKKEYDDKGMQYCVEKFDAM